MLDRPCHTQSVYLSIGLPCVWAVEKGPVSMAVGVGSVPPLSKSRCCFQHQWRVAKGIKMRTFCMYKMRNYIQLWIKDAPLGDKLVGLIVNNHKPSVMLNAQVVNFTFLQFDRVTWLDRINVNTFNNWYSRGRHKIAKMWQCKKKDRKREGQLCIYWLVIHTQDFLNWALAIIQKIGQDY